MRATPSSHFLKSSEELADPIRLTQALVRLDTVNPPGNERRCAELLGVLLTDAGFDVSFTEYASQRTTLVAILGDPGSAAPRLAFTGHLDTVPLGNAPWSFDPFSGEIRDGRLLGRGTSDMKAGVAAFVAAGLRCASWLGETAGIVLIITAGEETGCDGARHLVESGALPGRIGALVVGEPTANRARVGHKGALWLRACTHGRTAHGSMPEHGDNAIYKIADAVARIRDHVPAEPHYFFGRSTLNVGSIEGGLNINSVPDRASIGIDIRTSPDTDHERVRTALSELLGGTVELKLLLDAQGVFTDPDDPWMRRSAHIAESIQGEGHEAPAGVSYFTDASLLKPAFGGVPTVILGPGEPHMAHQTDEYALVSRIEEAAAIYESVIREWCLGPGTGAFA